MSHFSHAEFFRGTYPVPLIDTLANAEMNFSLDVNYTETVMYEMSVSSSKSKQLFTLGSSDSQMFTTLVT